MKKLMVFSMALWLVGNGLSAYDAQAAASGRTGIVVVNSHRPVKKKHHRRKKVIRVGTRIKKRPLHSVIIRFNSVPYMYASGVFYRQINDSEYEVVRPEIGMVVPELPQDDIQTVKVGGETHYIYDGVLYKPIPTPEGIRYKVVGFVKED